MLIDIIPMIFKIATNRFGPPETFDDEEYRIYADSELQWELNKRIINKKVDWTKNGF